MLKYSKNNIYYLVGEIEINYILIIISKEEQNNIANCKIKRNNLKNWDDWVYHPDELMTKVNKFPEIINEIAFHFDLLEIAEENLRNIKLVINKYYNGTDKNAFGLELKNKYVKIINDYMTIIEQKYHVYKLKIFKRLQKRKGDKDNKDNRDNIKQLLISAFFLKDIGVKVILIPLYNLWYLKINMKKIDYYIINSNHILEKPYSVSWIES